MVVSILPLHLVKAAENDGITLTYEQVPSTRENHQEFLTGEIMQSTLTFKANLESSEFDGAYLSLSYSGTGANYVDSVVANIDFATSEVFSRSEKVGNEQRIYFKKSTSSDAREAQVPVFTKFKQYETPDKAQIAINLSLKKASGEVVKTANKVVNFIGRAGSAEYYYNVNGKSSGTIYGGVVTAENKLDATALSDVLFTYEPDYYVKSSIDRYSSDGTNANGRRLYEKIILTQPLPPFAKFDASKNPNWMYDANTNTAIYTLNNKDYNRDTNGYNKITLTLIFPNADINTDYTATSTMEFFPTNKPAYEDTVVLEKSLTYRFEGDTVGVLPYEKHFIKDNQDLDNITGYTEVTNDPTRLNRGLDWEIKIANDRQIPLTVTEFKDDNLDPRLYYTGVELVRDDDVYVNFGYYDIQSVSNVVVKAVMADGSEKELGTVSTGRVLNFNVADAKNIKSLSFVFPNGQTIAGRKGVYVKVKTQFRQAPILDSNDSKNIYANSASYKGVHADGYRVAGNDTAKFKLIAKKADIGIDKTLSDKLSMGWFGGTRDEPLRSDGELAIWELGNVWGEDAVRGLSSRETLTNVEIIDLLPEGVEYVRTETGSPKPQVNYISNYQDSGLNAVVIKYASITVSQLNRVIDYNSIKVITRVTSESKPGQNVNRILVKLNGEFIKQSDTHHMSSKAGGFDGEGYVDSRDLDQDGDTTEIFAQSTAYYEYTGRYELIARKYIARSTVDNWNKEGLKTGPGTEFRYKLYNYNNKLTALNQYELVDLFPYVNDYTPARNATTNEYTERHSQFANHLIGPVTIATSNASKFTIEYTTDNLQGKVENPSATLNWLTSVDDYSQVTGVKIKLKESQTFNKNEELEAIVPMKAPENANMTERAWNDFIISSDSSEFVPTNKVWNEIYEPSSTLKLIKEDPDGKKLAGAEFTLTSKADPTKVYQLVTNEQGLAVLENNKTADGVILPLGEYTLTETKAPIGYLLDNTERTISIIEDEETNVVVKNNPIVENITVSKVWQDSNDMYGNRPDSITVNLLKNNEVIQTVTITKENDWKHTFTNLLSYENGQKNIYTVTENDIAGYSTKVQGYFIFNSSVGTVTVGLEANKRLWIRQSSGRHEHEVIADGDDELNPLYDLNDFNYQIAKEPFEFELKDENNKVIDTAQNNLKTGKVSFKQITFTKEGVYRFTIVEKKLGDEDVIYDKNIANVVVTVTKEDGKLNAKVSYDGRDKAPTFHNDRIISVPAKVNLTVYKVLKDKLIADNQFTFELKKDNIVVDTVKNDYSGKVTFADLTFTEVGTYRYTISEVNDNQENITYDTSTKEVVVTVTKDLKTRKLIADVQYDGTAKIPSFTNRYTEPTPDPISVKLSATKQLLGKDLADNQFTFELKKDNTVVDTVKNTRDGKVLFTDLTFTKEGTYHYTISEVNDGQGNMTYDTTVKHVVVTVTKEGKKLVAEVMYDNAKLEPLFTNQYVEETTTTTTTTETTSETSETTTTISETTESSMTSERSTTSQTTETMTPAKSKMPKENEKLPNTGSRGSAWFMISGLLFVSIGALLRRRKQ